MQNVLEKLLGNLVVAAFIPSLAFFTALFIFFGDLLPAEIVQKFYSVFGTPIISLIVIAICTSFALSYLSESIYLLYRGKFLPKWMFLSQKEQAEKLLNEIKNWQVVIDRNTEIDKLLSEKFPLVVVSSDTSNAINEKRALVERYQSVFPPKDGVLPTRFGNILASAEYYPELHYGMKSRQMWVRLKQVIPAESMNKIEQINHEVAFLINSSFFSTFLSGFAFLAMIYQFFLFLSSWAVSTKQAESFFWGCFLYGVLWIICTIFAWGFYQLSLPNVQRYAEIYRSTFDLYRFELAEKLRLNSSESKLKGRTPWESFDDFVNSDSTRTAYPDLVEIPKKLDEMEESVPVDDLFKTMEPTDENQGTTPAITLPFNRPSKLLTKKTNKRPLHSRVGKRRP